MLRAGLLALAGAAAGPSLVGCSSTPEDQAPVLEGRVPTDRMGGSRPSWKLALPEDAAATVVALHGHGGSLRTWFDPPLAPTLAHRLGLAVAAVDGGDTYWHARADGTDAGTMVLEDLLPALEEAGAPVGRVGFTGFSMGGYGALLLATRLPPERVLGVAAVSAALFLSPEEAAAGAFDDAADFEQHDVFERAEALRRVPVWLACGADDEFREANEELAGKLPDAVTRFDEGRHDRAYLEAHWPAGMQSLADAAGPRRT